MLTADVEQVRKEEGLLVEVFNGQDDRSIQAAPQGLLGTTLSAMSDSSMVRTMYSLKKKGRWEGHRLALHPGEKVVLCCISSLFFSL